MSSIPPLSRLATKALSEATRTPPAPSAADEERTIAAIARAIEARAARANRRRRLLIVASAAACIAGVVGIGVLRRSHHEAEAVAASAPTTAATGYALAGAVVLQHGGTETSLDGGAGVVPGDRLVAPAGGRASLDLSTGTHLVVEGETDLAVAELGAVQRFTLRSGAVHADVAKLKPGQRFIVETADAAIEVRGTSFRVSVVAPTLCGGGTTTRLSVTEGVVVVRSAGVESRVPAGHEWPEGCEARGAASPTSEPRRAETPVQPPLESPRAASLLPPLNEPPRAAPASPPPSEPARPPAAIASLNSTAAPSAKPPSAPQPEKPAVTSSDIAEQNRLFAEASSAKRRGASAEAITRYEAFLARYPSSQLAESAMVERMRLLEATNRAAGAAAAREYMNRFPGGFARQEAVALSTATP